jgi:hypothetical protein
MLHMELFQTRKTWKSADPKLNENTILSHAVHGAFSNKKNLQHSEQKINKKCNLCHMLHLELFKNPIISEPLKIYTYFYKQHLPASFPYFETSSKVAGHDCVEQRDSNA